MRPVSAAFLVLLAVPLAATAQTMLDCPSAASVTHCDTFHFHVEMYRPDTRSFVDLWGTNQFASQTACEHARDAQMKRNLVVVNYFRTTRGEQNYEADRFGTCHCDMSLDKTNPRYLGDAQRAAQLRLAEEVRQHVRERLLDSGLQSDSEIVRSAAALSGESLVELPRMVKVPASGAVQATSVDELKSTKAVERSQPSAAALDDLPLVDVNGGDLNGVATLPPPVPLVASAGGSESAAAPLSPPPAPTPPPAAALPPAPMPEVTVVPDEDAAEAFVSSETQRIENVLKASSAIGDENVKAKIYEACMQRIQLLSNLRTLIQTAGAKSRLADFARNAHSETERLAFIGKLFGDDMRAHWAPADARDVILPAALAESDPERALRDASGKVTEQQKKHALYVFLARTQPTEEQQLWLSTVADSLLQ